MYLTTCNITKVFKVSNVTIFNWVKEGRFTPSEKNPMEENIFLQCKILQNYRKQNEEYPPAKIFNVCNIKRAWQNDITIGISSNSETYRL